MVLSLKKKLEQELTEAKKENKVLKKQADEINTTSPTDDGNDKAYKLKLVRQIQYLVVILQTQSAERKKAEDMVQAEK